MTMIKLSEQDKAEIRLACIAADINGESPATIGWMSACAELPADTWVEMPPHPRRKDQESQTR